MVDPAFIPVGTTLLYDGSTGIGGAFGETLDDRYVVSLDEALTYASPFKATATVVFTYLKLGNGVVIGCLNPISGSHTYIQLHSTTVDQVIDKITFHMDDGPSATVSTSKVTSIDVSAIPIIQVEWSYGISGGFATSRVVIRDPLGNILADVSDNIQQDYSATLFGIFSVAADPVSPPSGTGAVLTSLLVDSEVSLSSFDIDETIIAAELAWIAKREASVWHDLSRSGTVNRWIEETEAMSLEYMGFENRTDFDAMANTNAEQLARRQSLMRIVLVKRVSVRVLEIIDANRSDPMTLGYGEIIKRKTNEANRASLFLMRLFHPDSMPETVTSSKPADSTYPLRPSDA